ncbi:MAG: hypothetical protein Q9208_008526 [Pyrenodesmia sp. 3 TL-2023]
MLPLAHQDPIRILGSPSQPHPPPSQRSSHQRFNDAPGPMTIELFLYRTEPYRTSSESSPLPFPYRTTQMVPAALARLQSIANCPNRVRKILVDLGLQVSSLTPVMRSKVRYAGGAPRPMIKVHVRATDHISFQQQSETGKQQIQGLLTSNGVNGFSVEILDPDRVLVRSIFSLPPSNIIIEAFEGVSKTIVDNLCQRLANKWTSVCLFKVGRTLEQSSYSVFVTVKPGTVSDWQRLQAQTQNIMDAELRRLGNSHLVGTVRADFVPGGWSDGTQPTGAEPSCADGKSFMEDLDGQPKLGCSIGLVGDLSGGGPTHRGFLTSHHVITPPKKHADLFRNHNLTGTVYGWGKEHPLKTKVQFFAEPDVIATKQDIETEIEINQDTLQKREESIKQGELAGMEPEPGRIANRNNLVRTGNKLLELRAAATKLPQQLGHIIVSSGRAQTNESPPRVVDWAFVSVDEFPNMRLSDHNVLPTKAEIGSDIPDKYVKNVRYLAPEGPFQNFGMLEPGRWYFKKGRTSGITGGLCHGTSVVINSSDAPRGSMRPDGTLESPKPVETVNVAIIVNTQLLEPGVGQKSFCNLGDSGSLIFDEDGSCCGLMSGNWSQDTAPLEQTGWSTDYGGGCVESGLAMDMRDVQKWIAQRMAVGGPAQLIIPSKLEGYSKRNANTQSSLTGPIRESLPSSLLIVDGVEFRPATASIHTMKPSPNPTTLDWSCASFALEMARHFQIGPQKLGSKAQLE